MLVAVGVGWLLGIDTATRRGNLALARVGDSGTTASDIHLCGYDGANDHAERLLGELSALSQQAGVAPGEIRWIAVGIGPGSFTGVRVGVATAKALALCWGAQAVPVGALEAMAAAYEGDEPRIPVIDARRDELFVAVYDARGGELRAPAHVRRDALAAWLEGVEGVVLGEIEPPASHRWHRSEGTDLPGARGLLRVATARIAAGGAVAAATLEPAYLRPPDAILPTAAFLPPAEHG